MRQFFLPLVLLVCNFAHASGPEFFVNMADPQMGMYARDQNTLQEQANLTFAVASINRLKPAFVVVCGDLVNRTGDAEQIRQYKRIISELDPHIPVYNVAGNHDVGNRPTEQTLAQYRKEFGQDYYSFDSGNVRGIVLDSNLIASPETVPQESAAQEKWLIGELQRARNNAKQILIFQHIPYFLDQVDEPDQYFNIPISIRKHYLELFHRYGVSYMFSGHYHRNAFARDQDLEMITTGAVGMPLGGSRSGFRVVRLGSRIDSRYYDLGAIPHAIDPEKDLPKSSVDAHEAP